MIFSISDFFIRRPVFATVCSIVVALLGVACIPTLPVALYPDIAPPQVSVIANYIGANAEVVESTVTNVLERELNGISGVRFIKSASDNTGVSKIDLTFELGRDQDLAAVDVQNRVSTVESRLPGPVVQTGVQVQKVNNNFLLAIGMYSDRDEAKGQDVYDDVYLSNYADLYIADALKRLKGVGDVQIFGERTYAMRLWLDPDRLASRSLTPQDVVAVLQQQNLQVGAGQIGQPPAAPGQQYQYSVNAQGRLKNEDEFNNLVIRTTESGALIRLRDVGRAELGAENYGSVLRFTSSDRVTHQGIGLGINQQFGSNALDTAKAVRDEMQRLAANFPPAMHYEIAFDTTIFIQAGAEEVVLSLFQSIALVVIIIYLFLQDWRSALIAAITIPIAFLGTFIFVKLLGFSINTLTLFGLTLSTGLVVDDAIVIIEDITRRIQEEGMRPVEAAIKSMNLLFTAVVAQSIVLITVFVPVAFFPGVTGQLYNQFALTISFSVLISSVNALTFTPMLSAVLLKGRNAPNNWFFNWINRTIDRSRHSYGRTIANLTRHKGMVVAAFIGSLVLTGWVYTLVPTGFIPEEDQGVFITIVQAPEGVSINYTEDVLEKAEAILKEVPEVQQIFAVGGFGFSGSTPNNGLIFTTLKPWEERTRSDQSIQSIIGGFFPTPYGLFPKMLGIQEATVIPFNFPAISGIGNFGGFEFHMQDRLGLDFKALGETLNKFIARASTYPSADRPQLAGLRPNFNANTPQISVEVDRAKANALGVSVEDVFNTLQVFLGSTYVNDFNLFNRAYRVYVQADSQFRSNPEDIQKLYVRSQNNQMVPLSNLVTVRQTVGPSIISHYNLFRSIEINGAPAQGVSSGQAIEAMEAVAAETLPKGFGFQWSGLSLEEIESGGQAYLIFGLGVVFVFLTLAAQYESYVDPFIIMLTVPLAILGALVAVLVKGSVNDIYTQVSFVMLIGLASKNSILIVEFANQAREEGLSITKAAIEASRERLRPILMTAIAAVVGAVPLAVATGAGAAARQSLGVATVGGLCIATVLSLFVVPILYIIIKKAEERFRRGPYRPATPETSSQGHSDPGNGFSRDGKPASGSTSSGQKVERE